MELNEIFKKLEGVAPVALSDNFCKKYGLYDNSGIIINCGGQITGALFSLDLSSKAIELAQKLGYNLIVTHHPAIYGGISRLNISDPVAMCVKLGISVISMHLNFDCAPKGIDYYLMRGLGGKSAEILDGIEGGGYGRVYDVTPVGFEKYFASVKEQFKTNRAVCYGSGERIVKKVASFCGAGCDDKAINFALSNSADVFVSSDLKHHEIAFLLERKVNVIHLTHYSAECYGFNKIYNDISSELGVQSKFFTDEDLV